MTTPELSENGQQVALMIRHIEEVTHRDGWGKTPPMIYRIDSEISNENLGFVTVDYFTASGMELHGRYGTSPEAELEFIVEIFETVSEYAEYKAIRALSHGSPHRPVAHIFMAEAQHTTEFTSRGEFNKMGITEHYLSDAKMARYALAATDNECIIMYRPQDGEPRWLSPDVFNTPRTDVQRLIERLHAAEVRNWMRLQAPNN